METSRIYKTENNSILIVTASTEGCSGRNYVFVTADEIVPLTYEQAKDRSRESLEDGELWRMAVEAQSTEMGLSEWVEMVLNTDGEISQIDNSLFPTILDIEGEKFVYESSSCGCLHDEIKSVTNEFDTLIRLHLKDNPTALKQAETIILKLQKSEDTDVDFQVEKITREIMEIEA